ncbi:universal stress protein [Nocardia farcinica]|uniref:universal stress protein n=1 Tax=Nocardia farcinica TaxID=37329 RepID=UPI001894E4AA|nr:universal stress protein [Nocardia farcinica]MBF6519806.1 universal stress protein [Nocardia farcinica]
MQDRVDRQTIVVGIDGSRGAVAAARWAGGLAARLGAPLALIAVVATVDFRITAAALAEADIMPTLRQAARRTVEQAADAVRADRPDVAITEQVVEGLPARELVSASEHARMLVVAATADDRISTFLLGSTALQVANKSRCPVAVWRGDPARVLPDDRPVLVGVDGSPEGDAAVGHAFALAAGLGVELVALHAWNDPDLLHWVPVPPSNEALAQQEESLLGERLAGWTTKYPDLRVTREVRKSPTAPALLERAADAQVIVTGSRGRNRVTGTLLGSTSQNLLHHAPCPTVVCRTDFE